MPKLAIRDTRKYGNGVFALDNIPKGEIVYHLKGRRIDVNDMVRAITAGKEHIDNPLQIGKRTHLQLSKVSKSFNHSCDPNCGIRKNTELFAIRDIKRGEELTYDYSLTVAPTEWKMRCKCGSLICRKVISDILSIPKKRLDNYIEKGAVQDYMKEILKSVRSKTYSLPSYEKKAIEMLSIA